MFETNFLSKRIQSIKPSPTLNITDLGNQLKQEGKDVVGFGAGEPDFDTPEHIKDACKQALEQKFTKYTPAQGMASLREAIQYKFSQDNQLEFSVDQIIVGTGAKQMIYNLLMSVIDLGDEVVIPAPYWVSYYDMVVLAEGKPKVVQTSFENHFKLQPEELEMAISRKTKLVILNSPSNPTGAVYTKEEMLAICKTLEKYEKIMIMTDDIYEKLVYDDLEFYNPAMLSPQLLERTVVINGFSKAFAMTGWRLGYAASKMTHVIKAMIKLQGQSTSNPTSFSQKGGETALKGDMSFIDEMKKAFVERRDFIYNALNECTGIKLLKPGGAFYIFPVIKDILLSEGFQKLKRTSPNEKSNSKLFATALLEEHLVAVVPGVAFGYEDSFRLSYAASMEQIKKGLERIITFIKDLSK